jgi:8-oxo-dGTP pyrophosphatase MutT (NUDIX family)
MLSKKLVKQEPSQKGLRFAAVSIILEGDSPKVLLIKRAERSGDPWSGQIAFPGGKMNPEDRTARDAAIRETLEEVGIDLAESAEFLGYAGVTTTHTGTMDVVPTVFVLKEGAAVHPNQEVASYRWVDLDELLAPDARSTYRLPTSGEQFEMPAFMVGDYVIWGLTYRILSTLFGVP